ncbi:deoxyribose-phosphate aldolase [[Clostridium] sordellii]|uniref:deoxyribose-phosphate aldolase n=1 Tax=Paraclostridium sordellii TaxID=1505 RepID=UPI0005DF7B5F|nr:deoxyribose-phosphate aldolase [Paeniclostridium sordellii]MDU1454626.1 deoxyribose-phosphate aldolase [Paeniclostridium sordellii]MDU2686993.1 deoxyribose-phosphate aldolase [Paeniclostridium sordellii]CEN84110.1 deoxyribose-phosphate aldolase [[Clostridium] sordellii] [Paeniclostridium sordellii]CEO10653.1 deoxyribose-phosphate aldolase [[Clostridium] sordellii] [Paeniclostridium sordellii]CEQ10506.1 deoxyribose-phosphate aldolase [[Clostridium] sordellii] [Paeniclostridium sordellii]
MNNNIANMIDHTILKAVATKEDVKKLCNEAKEYNFFSVCINPANIEFAKKELEGSSVKVCTVIGFPLGANTSEVKAFETKDAIKKGADEVDMVINIGALKDKDYDYVLNDIKAVVDAANKEALVKVIIETCYLTDDEKKIACELSVKAGADFVKTSTGFGTGGSTPEDIKLMREVVGPNIGVKASGGVRNQEDAKDVIKAGCSRIGASASVAITKGEDSKTSGY